MAQPEKWPRELYIYISKLKYQLESYGFRTDYDEMFEQLGLAILVCQHKIPYFSANLLGATIRAELMDIQYKERKVLLRHLAKLYKQELNRRRALREKRKRKNR